VARRRIEAVSTERGQAVTGLIDPSHELVEM